MVLQSSGKLYIANIKQEYGLGTTMIKFSDLYKTIGTDTFSTVGGRAGVGVFGSSNVPVTGPLSISKFFGQTKRDTTLVTFPPALSNFTTHCGATLLARSFAATDQPSLTTIGWDFSKPMTFTSTGVQWTGSGTITTPVIPQAVPGIGVVVLTVVGTQLEGAEAISVSVTDGSKTALVATQTLVDAQSSTITIDIRSVNTIDRFSPSVRVMVHTNDTTNDNGDAVELRSIEVKSAETFTTLSSTNRGSTLASWGAFNGLPATGPYDNYKWQSHDACYDSTTNLATNNPLINGFNAGYNGQWIGLAAPYPLYLANYTLSGDLQDWRLYASIRPSDPGSWVLLHEVTGRSGVYTTENTYTINPSPSTNPYICFVIKIGKSTRAAGFGRCSMRSILYRGYRA